MPSKGLVAAVLSRHRHDRARLIDVLRDIQAQAGCISPAAVAEIAGGLGLSTVEVEGVATFYHFFSARPAGTYAVYLNDNIVSVMKGRAAVAAAFEKAAGCAFGETTPDGRIGLHQTSCIGMNDQEPSALINGVVFTNLTPAKARVIVEGMKAGMDVGGMVASFGDGANASKLVRAMVKNNIRKEGPVVLAPFRSGRGR